MYYVYHIFNEVWEEVSRYFFQILQNFEKTLFTLNRFTYKNYGCSLAWIECLYCSDYMMSMKQFVCKPDTTWSFLYPLHYPFLIDPTNKNDQNNCFSVTNIVYYCYFNNVQYSVFAHIVQNTAECKKMIRTNYDILLVADLSEITILLVYLSENFKLFVVSVYTNI